MGITDIIILICFLPAIYTGLKNGLISQLVTIITIVVGAWLSFHFSEAAGEWMSQWLDIGEKARTVIAFICIFIVTSIALNIIGKMIEKSLNLIMLGWVNKLLGVVFAIANCALIMGLLILLFTNINDFLHIVDQDTLDESVFFNPIKEFAYTVFPYFKELLLKK